jgi:hypothetical protein
LRFDVETSVTYKRAPHVALKAAEQPRIFGKDDDESVLNSSSQACRGGRTEAWYAGFLRKASWQVGQTKGISREAVVTAFPLGAGAA